jgi:cytochrome c
MVKHILIVAGAVAFAPAVHAQADPAAGQKQFGQCRACHTVVANGPDGLGPNLVGVVGSKAATRRPKFKYSAALKASKLTWDDATLDRWLTDPAALVPGTSMHFVGLPRKPVRANVIAYLKTLK